MQVQDGLEEGPTEGPDGPKEGQEGQEGQV